MPYFGPRNGRQRTGRYQFQYVNVVSVHFPFALAFFSVTVVRGGRLLLAPYALALGAKPFTVGMLAATFSALPMMMAAQLGRLSERIGSRWPLVIGIGVQLARRGQMDELDR